MVANSINPSNFTNQDVRHLAMNNPGKLAGILNDYRQYAANGGKFGQEEFIMSVLADEGGVEMGTGKLSAAYQLPEQEPVKLKTRFKNAKCQLLAENNFDRCVQLMTEWNATNSTPGTLANKLDQESYIALHADLNPGEVPWSWQIQEAIAESNKQAKQ